MSVIVDETGKKKFDIRTHIRDPKTGTIIKHQPYRRICSREHGVQYERDGVRYFENGNYVNPDAAKKKLSPETVPPQGAAK